MSLIQTPTDNLINQPALTLSGEKRTFSENNSVHPEEGTSNIFKILVFKTSLSTLKSKNAS